MSIHQLELAYGGGRPTRFHLHFRLGVGFGSHYTLTVFMGAKEYHIASDESESESEDQAKGWAHRQASKWLADQIIFDETWKEVFLMPLDGKTTEQPA